MTKFIKNTKNNCDTKSKLSCFSFYRRILENLRLISNKRNTFFFVAKKKHVQNLQEIMQQLKWESKILTESKTAFSWCEFVCTLKDNVIDPDSLVGV